MSEEKVLTLRGKKAVWAPAPAGGGGDWAVNDPNAAGYVKNRTHWSEETIIPVLCDETSESFNHNSHPYVFFYGQTFTEEEVSKLTFYMSGMEMKPYYKQDILTGVSTYAYTLMGMELELFAIVYEGNEPGVTPGMYVIANGPVGTDGRSYFISGDVHKLDMKYIPRYYVEFERGENDVPESITMYPSIEDFNKALMSGVNIYAVEKGVLGADKIYNYCGLNQSGGTIDFSTQIDGDGNIHFFSFSVSSEEPTGTLASKKVTLS